APHLSRRDSLSREWHVGLSLPRRSLSVRPAARADEGADAEGVGMNNEVRSGGYDMTDNIALHQRSVLRRAAPASVKSDKQRHHELLDMMCRLLHYQQHGDGTTLESPFAEVAAAWNGELPAEILAR